MAEIQSRRDGSLLIVTIANEAKRNAFTHAMTQALGAIFEDAETDPTVRCVLLTGAGDKAFSSGHDLSELLADRDHAADEALNAPFYRPRTMTTPTIAVVNGAAHAGGFILALSCDIRVCAANADFAAPGARIGLLPIGGQISRLPALVPLGFAYEMLATGRRVSAEEASRFGLVNHISLLGAQMEDGLGIGRQIAANSPSVIAAIKRGLNLRIAEGEAAATRFEWEEGGRMQSGPDADEGVRAFLEKRSPVFQ
jgi:enoyl-CoA hydratase/carnithine racemase